MKTIVYLVFFSMTSGLLLACGGEKTAGNEKAESALEAVTAPEKITKNEVKTVAKQVKKDGVDDTELSEKLAIGEKLVKEHCTKCHQAEMYTRAESKIKSVEALLAQVKACDANIGSGLFDEDMDAITAYLEVNFYKFAK